MAWLGLFGCAGETEEPGGDDGVSATDGDGGARPMCIDEDEDGFGRHCRRNDCDDTDPTITDECVRCAGTDPVEGCPCEPGTRPWRCDPEDQRTTMNGVSGTVKCDEGAHYCRDGAWTECEIIWMYATFVPD